MKKKEGDISDTEILARLYANTLDALQDSTLGIISFYDKQSILLLNELYELKDNEPLRIFRKAHKQWEETIDMLEIKYNETFNKYIEKCNELEEIMENR